MATIVPKVTYTPNGIRRAAGFFDPTNPYDTGYSGQRNAELNQGQKNTYANWDYDKGAPIGATLGDDGIYRLAGGEGGRTGGGGAPGIPGASVMAQGVAAGLAAYKKALARLNQGRMGTLGMYGYKGEVDPENGTLKNMSVDSSNPFGVFQGLRRNNAFQFSDLRDQRLERGLGAKGIGAQGLDRARYSWGQADTSMAQALQSTLGGYDEQQQGAWQSYQDLLWQMQLEAARAAGEDGDYGWDPGGGDHADSGLIPVGEDSPGVITGAGFPGLAKTQRPVKVNGQWRGAWGPVSPATRKIVNSVTRVKPGGNRAAVISPSVKATPKKAKAIQAALKKKKGGR